MSRYLDWKVGDRVVCVDNSEFPTKLSVGAVYTISAFDTYFGKVWVGLDETPGKYHVHWEPRRFRKVQPRKTDISIFTAMLNDTKQKVDS